MKYTTEIIIDLPVSKVIELFDNPDLMVHWMEGLQSFEALEGKPGQVGAKSRLRFQMKNRSFDMIETIVTRNLPDEFSGTYETQGITSFVCNRFIPIGDQQTKYISENEFTFSGFMKILGWLMPGAFKKQSLKYQTDFKNWAEKYTADQTSAS